jgi:hypothetical protein
MTERDDDLRIRPGRIRNGRDPTSFVGEVMRAAKKAGHTGTGFGKAGGNHGRSTFGRGRRAALSLSQRSPGRRVAIMSRIVRHRGISFRSAPLSKHVTYLKRDGVTHDGADARMFDARSDMADERTFAERCEDDRHHFRFIVSPEDAAELESLRTFTRELMADAERDLGTKLDWIAVDHWNTDNPHVHVLIRGRAGDGKDLVISRDYISRGFRHRAAERVTWSWGLAASTRSAPPWRRRATAIGGAVPRGADAVVMIEHTGLIETPEGPAIDVRRAATPGQFVAFAGSDMTRGETVLRRSQQISSREIGILAACGIAEIPVVRRPKVAVLSTGDELVLPGTPLPPAGVYDSNGAIVGAAKTKPG